MAIGHGFPESISESIVESLKSCVRPLVRVRPDTRNCAILNRLRAHLVRIVPDRFSSIGSGLNRALHLSAKRTTLVQDKLGACDGQNRGASARACRSWPPRLTARRRFFVRSEVETARTSEAWPLVANAPDRLAMGTGGAPARILRVERARILARPVSLGYLLVLVATGIFCFKSPNSNSMGWLFVRLGVHLPAGNPAHG